MDKRLADAVALAERLRFSGDISGRPLGEEQGADGLFDQASGYFAQSGLQVSKDITPSLFRCMQQACERISVPLSAIEAYVYASPEIQAHCFSAGSLRCAIRLASGLVHLLSPAELNFVIGHEVGHFLLGHGQGGNHDDSVESFMQSRAQEISVDRLGLLAGQSIENGIRSLMKTMSGLEEGFLRFDTGSFLRQIKGGPEASYLQEYNDSHPSLVIRCRALLWFSMSGVYAEHSGGPQAKGEPLQVTDQRIQKDLAKYVDGHVREEIAKARKNLTLWLGAAAAIRDGVFESKEQEALASLVGKETLGKLLGLYSSRNRMEIEELTKQRLNKAFDAYQALAPKECSEQSPAIIRELSQLFFQPDLKEFVFSFIREKEEGARKIQS